MRLYRANSAVRCSSGTVAGSSACSVGRNTLTSPPLGLSVPMRPMMASGQNGGERREADPGGDHEQGHQSEQPATGVRMGAEPDDESERGRAEQRHGDDDPDRTSLSPTAVRYAARMTLTIPSPSARSARVSRSSRASPDVPVGNMRARLMIAL